MSLKLTMATKLREKGWETPYLKRHMGTLEEYWGNRSEVGKWTPPDITLKEVHHGLGFGRIGLGTYRWDYRPDVIDYAVDNGVTFIDTAEGYGYGRAEEALGLIYVPESVVIATKVGRQHMSKASVIKAAERSLKRLRRETIDLYQTHWPSPRYPMEDTVEAFDELWRAGKIRYAGLSNCSIYYFERFQRYASIPVISLQVRLNMREREKADLIPLLREKGVKLIAYSPLGQAFKEFQRSLVGGITPKRAVDWVAKTGALPIPQTNKLKHLQELLDENI